MFKKLSKKFQGKEKSDKKEPTAATSTGASNTTTQTQPVTGTSALTVPSTASSSLPSSSSSSSFASSSSSPTLPISSHPISASPTVSPSPSLIKLIPSSSSSPPLFPSGASDLPNLLALDSAEGKVLGGKKKSSISIGKGSAGGGGEGKRDSTDGNGAMNGMNGTEEEEEEEDTPSGSSPHRLTRSDLLKPIPSLTDSPSTPPSSVAAPASSSASSATSPTSAKQALFIHKLRLCCITFDWSKDDPSAAAVSPLPLSSSSTRDSRAKESKRQQLLELLDYIGKAKNIYNDTTLYELMHMIAVNLFRALPPRTTEVPSEEDDPVYEPSWAHLQIIYELFLRFIVNNEIDIRTLKKHIHASFVLHLLELFDSEDHRERDYLKTILHRIYAKFMSLRAFIRKAINHVFFAFIYEQDGRHNGIAELLEILGSIINGFALPLKHEHKLFLRKVLIPMHKVRSLHHFHQQLAYCVSQFVDKDPELAVPVLSGLLHYWPISNSAKEVLFLNELEQLLELTQPEEFSLLVPQLFRRVAAAIGSPHFQVAERALFLWHNEYISHLIAQHRDEILPILYPVLSASSSSPIQTSLAIVPGPATDASEEGGDQDADKVSALSDSADGGGVVTFTADGIRVGHWNPTVNNLTANVLKIFVELDAALVDAVKAEGLEKEEKREKDRQERRRVWKKLEDESGKNGQGHAETAFSIGGTTAGEAKARGETERKEDESLDSGAPLAIDIHQVDDLLPIGPSFVPPTSLSPIPAGPSLFSPTSSSSPPPGNQAPSTSP